ncbi:purine-nucleoside phosphorylase [Alkalispirochaeta sphaeroplastigenens]|uniref:Purine nucleoside phosphorylase n=1 Tax=Alkalispirochaeta sphaeroplastigenens TaxID=1187066 RepID=A0A2S4JR69_9SPIO|nr:purine-nucleoside phosphorylase [Alkalispirochaeta sphaeroplastigenens]POR02006.1 purine-nucleoside phosphorylase [Alkalispirochaeta sphaeroplastigenens]
MATIEEAADYIRSRIPREPRVGLILGSGLGVLGDDISGAVAIPYAEIPGFPLSTVEGHAGRLVVGTLGEGPRAKTVVIMQGRFHYYEGYPMEEVVFPVRVMKRLGVETLVVTNAAGGVEKSFSPGELMLITDHIKFFTDSPLRGPNDDSFGPRFNDMSTAYTPRLQKLAREVARDQGITLREGVYAFMAGPSFETPAEITMLRTLGASAVGMSTVPEVITAAHAGLEVLGISAISNMAAGILDQPLNHEEVMETGLRVRDRFIALIQSLVEAL